MAKNTKKSSKGLRAKFSALSRTNKVIVIVLVALVGTLSMRAIFAQTVKEDYSLSLPTEKIALSISDEKPQVISRNANGSITHQSRGKSIDVTASGTVYCTPENNGPVRVVDITQEEVQKIINDVKSTDPTAGATDTDSVPTSIGNTKQLQIVEGSDAQTLQTDINQSSEGIKNAEKILETVCGGAQTTVPDSQVPVFTPDEEASKPRSQSNRSFSLIPKASAGGVPTGDPVLEEWTERHHVNRINGDRSARRLPILGRSNCLTIAARKWARHMSLVNNLYHSPLQNTVESECGHSWWRKIGENVGKGGTADSQYDAYMASPGHRANILDPGFQRVGVGAYSYKHPNSQWVLLWTTQLFAQCMGACAEK